VAPLAQALSTPVALVALPGFALLVLNGPRTSRALAATILCGMLSVWWLLGAGDLPDQVMRTAAVLAAATFALASRNVALSFTHRGLLALAVATVGLTVGFLVYGWSWAQLHWWVAFRTGAMLRLVLTATTVSSPGAVTVDLDRPTFDATLDQLVRASADLFPAALALQLLFGLALAVALAPRLAGGPVGRPLGRLADFRFSEHLGWALALAIGALLIPAFGPARPVAMNVLAVMVVLYGLRGLGVVLHGLRAAHAGPILYVLATAAVFFLLPGTVLLGVLDAGLNLRRRRPPASGV